MKLIILKTNLKEGLSSFDRVCGEHISLPILKNILLKVSDGKIMISATNLEIGVERSLSGKVIESGTLTVPFGTLSSIVSNVDAERVNLESDGNNLLVKTDNYQAKIQGMNPDDFPIIPKIEHKENYLEINTGALKESLYGVIDAAQFSEIRPELSGILFDFQIGSLKLVATDSFRLAEKTLYKNEFQTTFEQGFKTIIPLKTVQEIIRGFSGDEKIRMCIDPSQIGFEGVSERIVSRIIAGQYPDYEQIVPKKIETEITMNREQLLGAVKLVASFSGKVSDVRLAVGEDEKTLEVFSVNQYLGENNYLVPIKIKGPKFSGLSFNWRYLADGLKAVKSERILFGVNGENKPAIIKSIDDPSYFYLLMPIKAS
ncbi:MAG: DNA polymerase III subunit beta [Patescibacteria group bacterium]